MKSIAKMAKGLPVILAVVCIWGLILGHPLALANDQYERRIDQIDEALRDGRISLKTAVLRTARVLFSPHRAPLEGEEIGDETHRLALFEDVRRVFDELTPKEKRALRSLNRDLAQVIDDEESGGQPQKAPVPQRLPTTFDRVAKAYDRGEISLKDAVLLKAKLLFAPQAIETHHPFSVQAGEFSVQEPCLTGFYKDVHRVFDQLTAEEISFLGSLSPDLTVIMTVREQERSGIIDPLRASALPTIYPDLTETEEGDNCIVHYALAGGNAVPNRSYAVLVKVYMDMAIKSLTKVFPAAYAEGYPDFKGKLHVYIANLPGGTLGSTTPASTVSGNKKAVYIKIDNSLDTRYGGTWQLRLKGVSFHEYFHGVQGAYNWNMDNWCAEATSVWTEVYYAKDGVHVGDYYNAAESVFNKPNDILWNSNFRMYSTSALAFYLSDKFGGYNFIKSWMVNTETENDSIKTLERTLNTKDTVFTEEYIYFLASLYAKSIKSIKKYMPDVAFQTVDEVYGLGPRAGSVSLTGANFHVFNPQAGTQPGTFISTFKAGATGVPKGVLVYKKGKKASDPIAFVPINGSPMAYIKDFGKAIQQVALITTDATYAAKDTALRTYDYTAVVPNIIIRQVIADSPIYAGDVSKIDIHYDLTGTFPGKTFPVQLKVVEKGPGVADNASGELNLGPGIGQILPLWFSSAWDSHGTYKFTFELAVPPESWLPIPQVKTKGKCSVRVEESSWSTPARQATTRKIEGPTLTIK